MKRILLLVVATAVLGCSGEKAPAAGRQTPDAQRTAAETEIDSLMSRVIPAAAVTLAVQATPERADSILAENGFTLDRFEATLYTIAADSAAAQLFEAALGR
jgi:hypothetical protein